MNLNHASRPMRVLVVDDQPDIRLWLRITLAQMGADIDDAPGVEEALRIARRKAPDIVITDLMMPGADGNELIRQLHDRPATRHVPVIVLTAARRTTVDGAAMVLPKRCDARRITAAIDELLAGRPLR